MESLEYFSKNGLKPRKSQIEALKFLEDNMLKRYYVIDAPTGSGKTHIALAASDGKKSFVLTSTKYLQDQYLATDSRAVLLKGKANYPCHYNKRLNCENGLCSSFKSIKKHCIKSKLCPYYNQLAIAMESPIIVTNYDYFIYAVHCGSFSGNSRYKPEEIHRDILICDEAHSLESKLIGFAEFTFNINSVIKEHKIEGLSNIKFIKKDEQSIKDVLSDIQIEISEKCDEYKEEIECIYSKYESAVDDIISGSSISMDSKDEASLKYFHTKLYDLDKVNQNLLVYFKNSENNKWIYNVISEFEIFLSPFKASGLFEEYLSTTADKFIFMSATIGDMNEFIKELDLPKNNVATICISSDFDPENSPIISIPSGKMSFAYLDNSLPTIAKVVNKILNDNHPEDKGIIHTSNYKIADYIFNNSKYSNRLLHRNCDKNIASLNNYELIKMHMESKDPTVLVSPSMMEGVSLDDDLSRFQIIVKMPFLSLDNFRTKTKMDYDNSWYLAKMWVQLMQSSGRSTRSKDDYSVTYILDSSFSYFFKISKNNLSKWFVDRISC